MLRPFLMIGVGGSGGKTLRVVRDELLRRMEQLGWEGDLPAAWQLLAPRRPHPGRRQRPGPARPAPARGLPRPRQGRAHLPPHRRRAGGHRADTGRRRHGHLAPRPGQGQHPGEQGRGPVPGAGPGHHPGQPAGPPRGRGRRAAGADGRGGRRRAPAGHPAAGRRPGRRRAGPGGPGHLLGGRRHGRRRGHRRVRRRPGARGAVGVREHRPALRPRRLRLPARGAPPRGAPELPGHARGAAGRVLEHRGPRGGHQRPARRARHPARRGQPARPALPVPRGQPQRAGLLRHPERRLPRDRPVGRLLGHLRRPCRNG